MKVSTLLLTFLFPVAVLASGGGDSGHAADVSSLTAPFFNFILFAGGILFILRKKLKVVFIDYSDRIKRGFDEAEVKSKEASIRVDAYEKKVADIDNVSKKIMKDAEQDVENFANNHGKEVENQKDRMIQDYNAKVRSEVTNMDRELSNNFVDLIISKAREKISDDPALKTKVTKKLLSQIKD